MVFLDPQKMQFIVAGNEGGVRYDHATASTMTLTRFGELKRNLKLCIKDSKDNPNRGEPGYNPTYK